MSPPERPVLSRVIRPARADDAAALWPLCRQLGYATEQAALASALAAFVGRSDHRVLVAERDAHVAGWIHVHVHESLVDPAQAEIAGLVVNQADRGRGLGRALVASAETWAASRGLHYMRVRSNVVRGDAHRFYLALGYTVVKQQSVFRRTLAAAPPRTGPR